MDYAQRMKEAEEAVRQGRYQDALQGYKEIMDETEGQDVYYLALKQFADVVGYIGLKDYFQSIDLYQKIISEYEGDDQRLYERTQLDVARAYLELGLEMIENFDNTIDLFEPEDESMQAYQESLTEQRNRFIETEAERIYKSRM